MKTKQEKRLINMSLPIVLIEYIEKQAINKFSSTSQYITELILKDKSEKENQFIKDTNLAGLNNK